MKEVDGWLIQISTDYVFGKEPYNIPCGPDQKGTPTGVYGKTCLLYTSRRAEHFYSEYRRVRQGVTAWETGNL